MIKSAKNLDISLEIGDYLTEYTKEVKDGINKKADELSKEAVEKLKSTSPKKTGKYAKGWKTTKEGNTITIHNATSGQLTHLLEFGHVTRNGRSRTAAQPHIAPVEEWLNKTYEDEVKKIIEKSN